MKIGEMISKQTTIALFLLAFSPSVFPIDTLQIDQNITDEQTLVSPNSIFEVGFFSPGSSTYRFVGIWFTFSPDAVVWVANRDNPLKNTSGTLTLNKNGSIMLYDSSGRIVWSPKTRSSGGINSPILQLSDSGNLVLKDQASGSIKWQSFDYPSNTLLAGMKVGKNLRTGFGTYLSSWKSRDDPSEGDYTYKMDTQGAPEIIVWDRSQISWRSGMWNGVYFGWAPILASISESLFNFLFVWNQDEVSYGFEVKSTSTIFRLVLNETGIAQRFIWDQPNKKWNLLYFQTTDECSNFAKCGPFSICQSDGIQACSCLRGFAPVAPHEWSMSNTSGGCKRTIPLGCSTDNDGFYKLQGVKTPYSHDTIVDAGISIEECSGRCLMNCSCVAYTQLDIREKGSGCVMWNTALIDMKFLTGGQDLYVKVSKSELGSSSKKQLTIIVETISIALSVPLLCFVGYLLWMKKRYSKRDTTKNCLAQNDSIKDADLPTFDIGTILQATENFSITNIVGQGGFGIVYKGKLPCGQEIAVKRLSGNSSQGLNEFMNEVMLVAKLQHRNLVRLLGCCIQNNERMLIYEFLTNKSLDFFIFDAEKRTDLNWRTRLEIVTGISRGLLYLHHDSRYNIIHRDLKAANVLLDEEMNPKISDFGTARLFERDQGVISTETVIGTRGYMCPEYVREGKFSVKSDVYSFGVLLLEIMSGRRNQGNQKLVTDAWNLWEEHNILMLLDEAVESTVFTTELLRCLHVALLCVQGCPDDRPSMSSVCMMLSSDNLVLPAPKNPFTWRSIGGFPADHHLYEADIISGDQLTITGIEGR